MLEQSITTSRLRLLPSHPWLARQVLAYYERNRSFLQATDPPRAETFFTLKTQKQMQEQFKKEAAQLGGVRFWVQPAGSNLIIGMVALNGIVFGNFCSAYMAYSLDENFLNQGYATEALQAVVELAFNRLGLHRLELNILPDNGPSLRVAQKLGFAREGLALMYLNINGQWRDHVRFGLLNPKNTGEQQLVLQNPTLQQATNWGKLHGLCWRQAYANILPAGFLQALPSAPFTEWYTQQLQNPLSACFLAERAGQPAGVLAVQQKQDASEGKITALYLLQAYWGRGYGGQMLHHGLTRLRQNGCATAGVWVLQNNRRARRFFEGAGFTQQGQGQASFGGQSYTRLWYTLPL